MNLLCPNCQKMLTVPEQYAGQLMKCPLCAGTFTVPALPPSAPPPPPPPDIFGFKDPAAPPPTQPAAPPPYTAPSPFSSAPPPTQPAAPPPPPPPPLPPGEYTRKASIWFSPKVLQFGPVAFFFLIFVLQLFPWVGVYPGGYTYWTENAYGIVAGTATDDPNMTRVFSFTSDKDLKDANEKIKIDKDKLKDNRPGWGFIMLFYLLCFFALFALTIAATAIVLVPVKLPPAINPFLPWRWGVIFALNLALFFVLVLQLLWGFPLESSMRGWAESVANNQEKSTRKDASDTDKPRDTPQEITYKAMVGAFMGMVDRTIWLDLVIVLHILTLFCTLMLFWLSQRERFNKPLPELNLRW
jgi:hypothetical protein